MALSIKLCANVANRVRSLANERNCSQHWIMCEAIRWFVEVEEAKKFSAEEATRIGGGEHPLPGE